MLSKNQAHNHNEHKQQRDDLASTPLQHHEHV
ncbi:hypothetical protein BLA39750_01325 [Burkholderia lata]|uniref:Uncharacterized protein n=1 Tax=Burkholderia lata (strain ATCC 17760 / DSM 23089 / LMG 22485 / NCIMB 9086 / R18194 / 383) TaxID=482957 RepID=A0A6P2VT11_BURL3|nr:hypothetical protein BLA39750_01325 [Burkholderia lata]